MTKTLIPTLVFSLPLAHYLNSLLIPFLNLHLIPYLSRPLARFLILFLIPHNFFCSQQSAISHLEQDGRRR